MKTTTKISFIGFLLVALALAGNRIMYLSASKIMPYHLTAMGSSWENLPPGIQIMSLNFMKAAGGGFLTASIAGLFLLLIPFRRGESWSRWALLITYLTEIISIMLRVISVRTQTPGQPPLIPLILMGIIVVISFLLASGMNSSKQSY